MGSCNGDSNSNIQQTPEEVIIYTINWPARGLPEGVTIEESEYEYDSAAFTLVDEGQTQGDTLTNFKLTGGTPGKFYPITNTVTLSSGEVWQETLIYQCIATRYL